MTTTSIFPMRRGKVRDIYDISKNELVMVASDRVSAFDQVLGTELPGMGKILHAFSMFWADRLDTPYHCISDDLKQMPEEFQSPEFEGRTMLVQKMNVIPFECIIRGFLAGSAWKEYQKTGAIAGMKLPAGLQQNMPLPEPLFTPSTKAEQGQHDENVTVDFMISKLGVDLTEEVMTSSLDLYRRAYQIAFSKGVIIADTKFEWGLEGEDELPVLIDEILTPDSSRFWPVENYRCPGTIESIDKQYIRDYLSSFQFAAGTPTKNAPSLPDDVRDHALSKYAEALRRLTT